MVVNTKWTINCKHDKHNGISAGLFAVVLLENDDEIDRLTGVETDETLDRRLLRGFPGVPWEG